MNALAIRQRLDGKRGIAYCLEEFAELAHVEGDDRRSARLNAAAERLREELGLALSPREWSVYERLLTETRDRLDASAFASIRAEGRAMTTGQAIAYTLDDRRPPTGF